MTRLPQVFVPAESHKPCVQRCLSKRWLKRWAAIISAVTAGISANLISCLFRDRCLQSPKLVSFFYSQENNYPFLRVLAQSAARPRIFFFFKSVFISLPLFDF